MKGKKGNRGRRRRRLRERRAADLIPGIQRVMSREMTELKAKAFELWFGLDAGEEVRREKRERDEFVIL